MQMSEQDFLNTFRPQKPWICSVVDFLLTQPKGTASIEKIAIAIDTEHIGVHSLKESIYSAVRPRCPELKGFKANLPPIFENISGTLRLLSFPEKPVIGQEHELFFSEPYLQHTLESLEGLLKSMLKSNYAEWSQRTRDDKWSAIARDEKLRMFFVDIAASNKRLLGS